MYVYVCLPVFYVDRAPARAVILNVPRASAPLVGLYSLEGDDNRDDASLELLFFFLERGGLGIRLV